MHCVTVQAVAKVRRLEVFRFAMLSEGVLLIAPAASITPYTVSVCIAAWREAVARLDDLMSVGFLLIFQKVKKRQMAANLRKAKSAAEQHEFMHLCCLIQQISYIANDYGWACERCGVRAYEVIDTIILFRSCNNVKPLRCDEKEQASTAYGFLLNCSAVSAQATHTLIAFGAINNNKKHIKTIAYGDAWRTKCLQAQSVKKYVVVPWKTLACINHSWWLSLVSAGRHFSWRTIAWAWIWCANVLKMHKFCT